MVLRASYAILPKRDTISSWGGPRDIPTHCCLPNDKGLGCVCVSTSLRAAYIQRAQTVRPTFFGAAVIFC